VHIIPSFISNPKLAPSSGADTEEGGISLGWEDNVLPNENKLQENPATVRFWKDYNITWHYLDDIQPDSAEGRRIEAEEWRGRATLDGRVVREMRVGDSLALWARARQPNSINYVKKASVKIFWAI